MNLLRRINEKAEEYFLVASLAIMVILTFAQVIMRYIFNTSLTWSEELLRYVFLWQVWIGVSYAVKKDKHLKIDLLVNALKPKNKKIVQLIINIIWLVFSVIIFFISMDLVIRVQSSGQLTPALEIPMAIPYLSVATGFGLMCLRLIEKIYFQVKNLKEEVDI